MLSAKGGKGKRTTPTPGTAQMMVVTIHSKINHRASKDKGQKMIPSDEAQQPFIGCGPKKTKTKEQHQGFQRGPPP
jgi:hypothetical protein